MVLIAAEINLLLSYSNVSSQCLCGCVQTLPTAQAATSVRYWLLLESKRSLFGSVNDTLCVCMGFVPVYIRLSGLYDIAVYTPMCVLLCMHACKRQPVYRQMDFCVWTIFFVFGTYYIYAHSHTYAH